MPKLHNNCVTRNAAVKIPAYFPTLIVRVCLLLFVGGLFAVVPSGLLIKHGNLTKF